MNLLNELLELYIIYVVGGIAMTLIVVIIFPLTKAFLQFIGQNIMRFFNKEVS